MISIVVNLDSRPGVSSDVTTFSGHNEGARSWDFFTDGLVNKLRFFEGFDVELIAFIDEHETVPDAILSTLRNLAECVVIRSHTKKYRNYEIAGFNNDINYLHALLQARGDIIAHLDADTAVFARYKGRVDALLTMLQTNRFVSYPSHCSPKPVDDATFAGRTWASTRFFLCRREHLQFDVLERALREPQWAYSTYGDAARKCPWLEHFLSLTNEESVIYPPRDDDNLMVFCWDKYHTGILRKLNEGNFDSACEYVKQCGGIHYPNDVTGSPL